MNIRQLKAELDEYYQEIDVVIDGIGDIKEIDVSNDGKVVLIGDKDGQ